MDVGRRTQISYTWSCLRYKVYNSPLRFQSWTCDLLSSRRYFIACSALLSVRTSPAVVGNIPVPQTMAVVQLFAEYDMATARLPRSQPPEALLEMARVGGVRRVILVGSRKDRLVRLRSLCTFKFIVLQ